MVKAAGEADILGTVASAVCWARSRGRDTVETPSALDLGRALAHMDRQALRAADEALARLCTGGAWATRPGGDVCVALGDRRDRLEVAHQAWQRAVQNAERRRTTIPAHPLTPLVNAWQEATAPLARRRLLTTREPKPPKNGDPLLLVRTPGALSLATLAIVKVDGEPFASRQVGGSPPVLLRRYWVQEPQGEFFPGPRTLDECATPCMIVQSLAELPLTGDERSPLRADVHRLGNLAFALTGAARVTERQGALLVAGRDTPANRKRFNRAVRVLRSLEFQARPGITWSLADAEAGPVSRIGPARWMLEPDGKGVAWRLTGALFRPATRRGTLERTIAGLEGALAWGPSAGRERDGRIPDSLRPQRPGRPGPEVFVRWWQVLRLSGEPVGEDTDPREPAGRRYLKRVKMLEANGYFAEGNGTAEAGDTIEVVGRVRGGRARPAGVVVRASARWCAAYSRAGQRVRIPADTLLLAPPG